MEALEYIIRVRGGRAGKREADQVAEGFDNIAGSATRARVATAGMGLGVNQLSGRLRILGVVAAFTTPSIIALGSSAGAAAVGGAAVAGGGLAALGAGLFSILTIAKPAAAGMKKVSAALTAHHAAVAGFGRDSTQAESSYKRLVGVVATQGGRPILQAVRNLGALQSGFRRLTGPARESMAVIFRDGLGAARRLLPRFASETVSTLAVTQGAFSRAFRQLSGPEAAKTFGSLSDTFRGLIGPAVRGFVDVFIGMGRVFRAVGPYVVQLARGFAEWAHGFRIATGDSAKLSGTIKMLVGHFTSWWHLAVAVGRVVMVLFHGSEASGRSLVDSLTGVTNRFADWLEKARETGRLQRWFAKFGDTMKAVGSAAVPLLRLVGQIATALTPALSAGAGGAAAALQLLVWKAQILGAVMELLGPLAKPVVFGLIAWKVATIALTAATTALDIVLAILASPVLIVIAAVLALAAAFYLAYTKVGWFRKGVDAVVSIVASLPGKIAAVAAVAFDPIKDAFRSVMNWIIRKWNAFGLDWGGVKVFGRHVVPAVHVSTPDIPLLAEGGNVRSRGAAIVGERGPELLEDLPAGAKVTPLGGPWAGGDIVLKVAGRELARLTAREVAEQMAQGAH